LSSYGSGGTSSVQAFQVDDATEQSTSNGAYTLVKTFTIIPNNASLNKLLGVIMLLDLYSDGNVATYGCRLDINDVPSVEFSPIGASAAYVGQKEVNLMRYSGITAQTFSTYTTSPLSNQASYTIKVYLKALNPNLAKVKNMSVRGVLSNG